MADFAEPLARLILEFRRLPGIGQKSAQRIAFHLLRTGR
ncbi:MAG: recombination protein RecR, partial [Acidobacteria bacterium]|nr:recombination protein RecR [Acidobacteriota bacterium]